MMIAVADYVTVADAARELGISERAVHKRIASGLLRAAKFGAHVWMIPAEEVERARVIGRLKPGPKPRAEENERA